MLQYKKKKTVLLLKPYIIDKQDVKFRKLINKQENTNTKLVIMAQSQSLY